MKRQPKQKSIAELTAIVNRFNETYSIGSDVKLKLDSGEIKEVTVREEAIILGGHSAVAWFTKVSGCYSLSRVIGFE